MDKMKLSFPQKNIWLVEKFNEGTNINSIVGTIEIKNGFDTKKCNEAINEIIKNLSSDLQYYLKSESTF